MLDNRNRFTREPLSRIYKHELAGGEFGSVRSEVDHQAFNICALAIAL